MVEGGVDVGEDHHHHVRRGIVFDKWPFRLDISVEYQDWILVGMSLFILGMWSMPCICGRLKSGVSKSFTRWVYMRLHVFYCWVVYLTLFVLMFTIGVLPDWTVTDFLNYLGICVDWVLHHLVKIIYSLTILIAFFLVFKLRERVMVAAGLDHIRLFRFNLQDPLGLKRRRRPMEIFIWKVDELRSSAGKMMKANDIFVEGHLGGNETARTRVHNNAGSGCNIKESFQLNIDEGNPQELLHILVKDQSLLTTSEIARLVLSTAELCGIEDQTGKRRSRFTYSTEYFVPLSLSPMGQIWIAAAPVDDQLEEEAMGLMRDDDAIGLTC